jgi:hypothetical protein
MDKLKVLPHGGLVDLYLNDFYALRILFEFTNSHKQKISNYILDPIKKKLVPSEKSALS